MLSPRVVLFWFTFFQVSKYLKLSYSILFCFSFRFNSVRHRHVLRISGSLFLCQQIPRLRESGIPTQGEKHAFIAMLRSRTRIISPTRSRINLMKHQQQGV
jgi:hypothetical protein